MKWIKCSDRLPEEGQHVLIFDKIIYNKIYEKEYGFYDGSLNYYCPVGLIKNASHWMPLPQHPKDE